MKTTIKLSSLALLGALLLTGCSNQPSETEIRAAIEQNLSSINNAVSGLADLTGANAESLQAKVSDVKKISCKKVPKTASPTYECEVQVSMQLPIIGQQSGTDLVTLSKTSSGWIVR